MKNDANVQKIILWRESFSLLPDEQFLNLLRMYLGEIKTPYNKQKLLESLSSFLRKEENQENIICCLDDADLKILSAIKFIKKCDNVKLEKIFKIEFSKIKLYEKILNLKERLVIFSYWDKDAEKNILEINPILESRLESYLSFENIVKEEKNVKIADSNFFVTSEFLTLFISYINSNPALCKADLNFKKKTVDELSRIFDGEKINALQLLFKAFINLLLVNEKENKYVIDWNYMEKFASLSERSRLLLLASAATGHFSRSTITIFAQHLSDTINFTENRVYEKNEFSILSYFVKEFSGSEVGVQSRFSRLIAKAENSDFISDSVIFDSVVDSAVELGILLLREQNGTSYVKVSDAFLKFDAEQNVFEKKDFAKNNFININPGFTVTLMPGLSLLDSLSLVRVLFPIRYDTVSMLELSKKSALKAFESGMKTEQILSVFRRFMSFEIPQNIKISLEEWAESFASVSVYNGYILKVNSENISLVKNNPYIKQFIKEEIAPGVYFLNCVTEFEFTQCLAASSLNFSGEVITALKKYEHESFRELNKNNSVRIPETKTVEKLSFVELEKKHRSLVTQLKKEVSDMKISDEIRDGLMERIDRSIIINPSQLRPESVRFEILEAGGMDFTGKIHIIESAIKEKSLLQIELTHSTEYIIGLPFNLEKNGSDATFDLYLEPDKTVASLKVAAASRIKKLHGTALAFN